MYRVTVEGRIFFEGDLADAYRIRDECLKDGTFANVEEVE